MTDENIQKQPLSMTRRYRRGLILTGVLCVLAMLTAATLLFQRSYVERVDSYIAQICDGYAAAYKAQDTHDAMSFAAMLPEESARTLRFTLIDADGTVLFDSKTSALVYDSTNTLHAVMDSNLPNHADRPEFRQAMEKGSASLTRESETMQTETHYYALRIDTPDGTQVLRVGEDIANIWGLSADTLPLLCAAVVLILLAATLFETGMAKAEDIPTFAARIHKEAQRMIALVSDILQLSELDSNQASRTRETAAEAVPVDLAALVKETAQNMTVNARRAYVTLQYDARPATVRGSRDQLSELTQNLCDNAIRYNRPGGHVELRCGVGNDGCPYFEVEDNGIGIPQDSQTRVFERFYRVDKSRSKATGGTGLGLAIVKHIALLHDARIDLQSQVGTGTTIRVTFPKNS